MNKYLVIISAILLITCFFQLSQAYNIRVIGGNENAYTLGEGPHWVAEKQELLFVDIMEKKVIRYVPATDVFHTVNLDGRVTPVIPIEGSSNKYIVGVERDFKIMEWDGFSSTPTSLTSMAFVYEPPSNRFNDGKCDSNGQLWAGTMDESNGVSGNLYKLNSGGEVTKWQSGISISNGLVWSPDNSTFYYIDTPTRRVDAFDYDIITGSVSNRRSVFDFGANGINEGSPDGMTIDSNGNLWVCMWGGSTVHNIDPIDKSLIRSIDLREYASQITSAAFGGPNLEILYVTSAKSSNPNESASGFLFAIEGLGVTGLSGGVPYRHNN